MKEDKDLGVTKAADLDANKVTVFGDPDMWVCVCKASCKAQGWMKSTKVLETPAGCLVQVTTQQGDNVSEALTFAPGVRLADIDKGIKR